MTTPQVVPNRVLQLDGDMLCYECAYDDDVPFAQCTVNFETALQTRMAMAAAEYCNIHLTDGTNMVGNFDTSSMSPLHILALREWVQQHYNGTSGKADACYWNKQTASDAIAQRQFDAIQADALNLSIIMSRNISLAMCKGLHCDWVTYDIKMASTSSSRPSMAKDTKGTIALYSVLGLAVIGILANLELAAAVGPAIWLVIWLCRKVKGCFTG